MKRRNFIVNTTALSLGAGMLPAMSNWDNRQVLPERKFRTCLNPSMIGVKADQEFLFDLVTRHGFEAMVPIADSLIQMGEGARKGLLARMQDKGITWGAAGLPVQFRNSEEEFEKGLKALPQVAGILQEVGVARCGTWIMPTHKHLTYLENFDQHARRLGAIASILGHHGIKLGLEYVGPKTLMARDKFAFVRTMKEAKALIQAIGESNVGLVLDSFHWFCAGESQADLLTLDNKEIVTVDLNDARTGLSADDQIDGKRELPAATGVIDISAFVRALLQIGYDGPVRAEPFNQPLRDMEDEEAVKTTLAAISKAIDV